MLIKFMFTVLLMLMLGVTGTFLSRGDTTHSVSQAQQFATNAMAMGNYASHYAAANQAAVGSVTAATIGAPAWYTGYQGLLTYVNLGNAYLYVAPGGTTSPQISLNSVAGPGVLAGIQTNGSLIDGTGRALPTAVPIPAAIPNGSMVLVSRNMVPASTTATTVRTPTGGGPALPPGAAIGPPLVFTNSPGSPVAWNPVTPYAPFATATPVPPPPPPPPPYNPLNDPTLCMANGGMVYTVTPVQIGAGAYAVDGVSSFTQHSTPLGFATGSYTASVNFDGSAGSATVLCTGPGNDFCSGTLTFTVGPGTFNLGVQASSCLAGDCAAGQGIRAASGTVTQVGCNT